MRHSSRGAAPKPGTFEWWDARLKPDLRDSLSIERIARSAINILDDDGLDALTMRRVAAELEVAAPSLYRYVEGRDALLVEVVEATLAEVDLHAPEGDWSAQLRWLARSTRETLLTHPGVSPLLSTVPMLGPSARAIMRTGMRVCLEAGFPNDLATATCQALAAEVRGSVMYERADLEPIGFGPGTLVDRELLAGYMSDRYPRCRPTRNDELFEFLINCVISGIASRVQDS